MKYEVRCCCNPYRLYGWLHNPPARPEPGRSFTVVLRTFTPAKLPATCDETTTRRESVYLEFGHVYMPGGPQYLAVKYPDEALSPNEKMAKLRRVCGAQFEPAEWDKSEFMGHRALYGAA